ncbi:hypothetical protein AR275_24330 [Stenotrophomonas maltophilia]|nr:hypothetical protein AR275_24330 [Stenotrophomonas maltophilia]
MILFLSCRLSWYIRQDSLRIHQLMSFGNLLFAKLTIVSYVHHSLGASAGSIASLRTENDELGCIRELDRRNN